MSMRIFDFNDGGGGGNALSLYSQLPISKRSLGTEAIHRYLCYAVLSTHVYTAQILIHNTQRRKDIQTSLISQAISQ